MDAIEELNNNAIMREEIREYLNPVYDLERLVEPDQLPVGQSPGSDGVQEFPGNAARLSNTLLKDIVLPGTASGCEEELDALEDMHALIRKAIVDEPPMIHPGRRHHQGWLSMKRWTSCRQAKTEGKNWLAKLEERGAGEDRHQKPAHQI